MKLINPLQMSNWPIKKFFIVIFSFQLLFLGSIGLDVIGVQIPLLRQVVCFIYLSFVPGLLFLRILKLHNLESIENLLYIVGLSLATIMFMGLFMNIFYPFIGLPKPLSFILLILTVSIIVLFLCVICYIFDNDFSGDNYLYMENQFSIPSLFLCLIPLLTIIGTYLMNFYGDNSLLMIVIFLISLIVFLVYFDFIPSSLYPLAIFVTAFSLLFHNSLISAYIFGWDIQVEYYIANKVINNFLWDPQIFSNANSMLSIVMIAPIYSILLNTNPIWVFKVVYPVIFSLMPLGLYLIFKKQTDDKIAFMSTFFFISLVVFYTEMLQIAKQQVAEYFFTLILLLIVNNKYDTSNRILLLIFSFSLIVSHYGLSYLVIGAIGFTLFISYLYQKRFRNIFSCNTINFSFGILFTIFLSAWYLYTSSSSALHSIITIIENIVETLGSEFLNKDMSQGMYVITKKADTPLQGLAKIMHLLTQIGISIGLFHTLFNFLSGKKSKFNKEYLSLCLAFYFLLLFAILIPNFANALNASRIYQISLILLAPFCIIGFVFSLKILSRILKLNVTSEKDTFLKILCAFFVLFVLFNTGWIYELVGDSPTSFSLNSTNDFPKFNEKEITGKEWLYEVISPTYKEGYIYADYYRWVVFLNRFDKNRVRVFPSSSQSMIQGSYIYLSTYNIINNKVLISYPKGVSKVREYVFNEYSINKTQIYDNGGAKIYIQ